MDNSAVVWAPALLAVALGAAFGLTWALQLAARSYLTSLPASVADPVQNETETVTSMGDARGPAEDDERELDATLASLRELEEGRARLSQAGYEEEKARLEARAVALLQATRSEAEARAKQRSAPAGKTAARPTPARPRSAMVAFVADRPVVRRALWVASLAAIVAFLAYDLRQNMAPASAMAPGEASMATGPAGDMPSAEELASLRARIEADPNDGEALLRVAHLALRAQQFAEAEAFNRRAMAVLPRSLEGRTHLAVLKAKDGDTQAALSGLHEVVQEDPGFAEAWFFRGMLGMQSGDMDTMREAFGQFVVVAPDGPQKERVRAMLERSKS